MSMTTPFLHSPLCRGTIKDIEIMHEQLLKDRGSIRRRNSFLLNLNPMEDAVRQKHPECVRFLIESGANLNSSYEGQCFEMVFIAAHYSDSRILELLLQNGIKLYRENQKNKTGLIRNLCVLGCKHLKLLLDYDAVVSDFSRPPTELQPIIVATIGLRLEYFKLLLLYGASQDLETLDRYIVEMPDLYKNFSIIHNIVLCMVIKKKATSKKIVMLQIFKAFGGNLWQRNNQGKTALDVLKTNDSKSEIALLIPTLTKLMTEPLNLQDLSRLCIKHHMGRNYVNNICKLKLPPTLVNILMFEDVQIPLEYLDNPNPD